ncbi:uncharacterized protein LOC107815766 [Nicotiana tabacum]|uniref:Uncharacterized protein LOC107815766 n=1 Tax=Nicotiana tabacum TaxID=4097 RepID=A0A1S4C714_TOBAC
MVSAMRNIKKVRFPKPMRSDPSQRDPNLWCDYHGTNGHRTWDCRYLREEVWTLLKNYHLSEFLTDQAKKNYGRNRDNAEPSKAGILPEVAMHKLSLDPNTPPIRQKKHPIAEIRNKLVKEEVTHLIDIG